MCRKLYEIKVDCKSYLHAKIIFPEKQKLPVKPK